MVDTSKNQVFLFFVCFLFGIVVAVFFDITRASRRIYKTGVIATFIEDFLFFFTSAIMFFALSLKFNNGEIRLFMILSSVIGAFLYFNTVSYAVVPAMVFLAKLFNGILKIIIKIILLPFKLMAKALNRPIFLVLGISKRGVRRFVSKIKMRFLILKKFGFIKFKQKNQKN